MNLKFRYFCPDDAYTFFSWYHDPRLSHFFRGMIGGVSLAQCAQAPDIMRAHILVAVKPEDNLPIGAVTLADMDRVLKVYRLGFLVEPDCQDKGIGRFLIENGLRWAFDEMAAHRVYGEILESNEKITRAFPLAGFVKEGVLRKSIYLHGEYHNEVVLSVLKEDYDRRNDATRITESNE